jgi:cobalt-zinc-cadmium efflux system protein
MGHQHSYGHDHGSRGDIKLAFFLNLGFTLFEVIGGLLTNSVAILSDALHDLGDSISLGLAWILDRYSEKGSDFRYSYGYRRFSLLGALITSIVLISGSLVVGYEAVERLLNPEPFSASGMLLIAVVGVTVNGAAVLRLRGSRSLNAQVIGWHLLEDVLGWIAVLIVSIISLFVNAPILDPLLSIMIMLYILWHAVRNLRETALLFLQAAPRDVDVEAVERKLAAVPGVQSTHHTHVWSLDGEHNVLTTHLVTNPDISTEELLRIKCESREVIQDLHLEHATIEIELGEEDCSNPETADHQHDHALETQ